jgi:hypothetical protein
LDTTAKRSNKKINREEKLLDAVDARVAVEEAMLAKGKK